jgi:hypothetical protein
MTGLPWFTRTNGWVPVLVPLAKARFDRSHHSDRPAKLNLGFQRLNPW